MCLKSYAEEISYLELKFEIVEASPVNSDKLRLRFNEQDLILDKKQAQSYVAREILKGDPNPSKQKFSDLQVEKFISLALKATDQESAVAGITWLLNHEVDDELELKKNIELWIQYDLGLAVIKEALNNHPEEAQDKASSMNSKLCLFISGVFFKDVEWVRTNRIKFVYQNLAVFMAYLQEKIAYLVKLGEAEQVQNLLSNTKKLFGEDSANLKNIRNLIDALETLKTVSVNFNEEAYNNAISWLALYKKNYVVSHIIIELINEAVKNSLNLDKLNQAISLLSGIDFSIRTSKTHELYKEVLERLIENNQNLPEQKGLVENLSELSRKDSEIARAFKELLKKQILSSAQFHNANQAELLFHRLLMISPDPNVDNDALRFAWAKRLLKRGLRDSAAEKIADIKTGLNFWQRIWLFYAGYYFSRTLVTLIHLFFIVLFALLIIRVKNSKLTFNQTSKKQSEKSTQFVNPELIQKKRYDPVYEEFVHLLKNLGLEFGANEKEIKSAYRKIVKNIHPDSIGNREQKDTDRFIELTKIYERALELLPEAMTKKPNAS